MNALQAIESSICKWPGSNLIQMGASTITFPPTLSSPTTITSTTPFRKKNGVIKSRFTTRLRVKEKRTAIGLQFTQTPIKTYLTPTYSPDFHDYVSIGGAGFIYPTSKASSGSYGVGDTVVLELDWDSKIVTFFINGRKVGSQIVKAARDNADIDVDADVDIDIAWPSISSEGGTVVCEVETEDIRS